MTTSSVFNCSSSPAWLVDTVYSIGNRRINGGELYEVITAGTSASSGGPTGTGSDITDNTVHWKHLATIDYADLVAFGADLGVGISNNMTVDDLEYTTYLWRMEDVEYNHGTILFGGAGHGACDATRNMELTVPAGDSFVDTLSAGEVLKYDASKGVAIRCDTNSYGISETTNRYNKINRLQLRCDATTTRTIRQWYGRFHEWDQLLCLSEVTAGSSIANCYESGYGGGRITNCLAIINNTKEGYGFQLGDIVGIVTFATNCTAVVPSDVTPDASSSGFRVSTADDATCVNCASFGFASGKAFDATLAFHTDSDFNASDDTTGPGSNSVDSLTYTSQFTGTTAASQDWSVKSGAGLIDAADHTYGEAPSVDIIGTTRGASALDIGAYEFVGSGSTPKGPLGHPLYGSFGGPI